MSKAARLSTPFGPGFDAIYGWFTEGFDTAKALLDELAQ
jgi:hypothetical protein